MLRRSPSEQRSMASSSWPPGGSAAPARRMARARSSAVRNPFCPWSMKFSAVRREPGTTCLSGSRPAPAHCAGTPSSSPTMQASRRALSCRRPRQNCFNDSTLASSGSAFAPAPSLNQRCRSTSCAVGRSLGSCSSIQAMSSSAEVETRSQAGCAKAKSPARIRARTWSSSASFMGSKGCAPLRMMYMITPMLHTSAFSS
mmetsp:Transcript_48798/g.83831  ORF Transcript_48798/g.83831 Transcript_48798/m.83831 type:complete len:200 (+) Transcript_48798:565-1164(+)